MAKVALVIFDCDGVLVDSEPLSVAILLDLIRHAGGTISEEQVYSLFLGKSMATVSAILRRDFDLSLDESQIDGIHHEIARRFRTDLKPIDGMRETLARLKIPCCVASSGHPDRIRLALTVTGLLEFLDPHIYSASMVARGKPEPDLFLHAARDMGVAPAECLVIEDSPAGVDAAQSAGMQVFAFTGGSHARHAALIAAMAKRKPDRVFEDMRLLPDMIADLRADAA